MFIPFTANSTNDDLFASLLKMEYVAFSASTVVYLACLFMLIFYVTKPYMHGFLFNCTFLHLHTA